MENQAQPNIVILIVAGCLGMLILVAFIILFVLYYQKKVLAQQNQLQIAENKYQRELLSASILVEEKERERIAKNVHDDLGILLTAIRHNLDKIRLNETDRELVKSLDIENLEVLDEASKYIRVIAKDLMPSSLLKWGFVYALNELCKHLNKSGNFSVTFVQSDSEIRLPLATEKQLYRITKELLNNIIKHSGAKEITIELVQDNAFYNLLISHNGRGITSQQVNELSKQEKGLGLKSIQSRAQLINASVTYNAPDNERANIEVKLLS